MASDVESTAVEFRNRFGVDPAITEIDGLLEDRARRQLVQDFIRGVTPVVLDALGLLELAYCHAGTRERADELQQLIVQNRGPSHFRALLAALQFVSVAQPAAGYGRIAAARDFFARHQSLNLGPYQLRGCKSVEQMEQVLHLQGRIAGGNLHGFYNGGVHLADLAGYSVSARAGVWEAIGGTALHLSKGAEELVNVAGYFRWKDFRAETTIVSIQGAPGTQAAQQQARELLGIHPANAVLLLFLQLGRIFRQGKVRIRSRASAEYNYQHEDSPLYRIPRNQFRSKVDERSGMYEFDAAKRDRLLDKFAGQHEPVASAFAALRARAVPPTARCRWKRPRPADRTRLLER